ncbi:FecR family protein [Desertivirga xinjiangensis]|uniref:FecR family protein n=1 Tax=Desertivirga xinjiangensis TaxID=539206 RepID=UPI00210CBBDC
MDKDRFKQLAKRYFEDNLSEEELKEFLNLLESQEDAFYEAVDEKITLGHVTDFEKETAFEKLAQDERFAGTKVRRLIPYAFTAVACSILITLGFVLYFNQEVLQGPNQKKTTARQRKTVSKQEEQYAVIRLANGTQLALADISETGLNYDGVRLSKISGNLYKITLDPKSQDFKLPYHEFTTGKGISYSLLLPDGSKVDLNSGTILRLDPSFNVSNRDCELTGEAYFDVKRNESMAFRVKTRDYDVKVLGTQFNIKSYPHNNYSQTALVKGNVHVTREQRQINLLPGDQVRAEAGVLQNKSKANFREVLAWKEGYFRFTDANIKDIMGDIVTWYAISDIEYQYNSNESFTGSIVRTRSLEEVLASIEKISNLRFEIKEGRVIVRK